MARKVRLSKLKRSEKALALALKLGGASAGLGSDALLTAKLEELAFALQQESYREPHESRVKMLRALSDAINELERWARPRTICTFCEDEGGELCEGASWETRYPDDVDSDAM